MSVINGSYFISNETISNQLDYLNKTKDTLMVPILIDYSPVMLLSNKPYYLCIYGERESKTYKLGYASSLKYNLIAIKDISLNSLKDFIEASSFTRSLNKKLDVPPNEVISTEFYNNIGKSLVGSLNINTTHGKALRETIKEIKLNGDKDNILTDIVNFSIVKQSKLDAFIHMVDNTSDSYKPLKNLSNLCFANVNLTGEPTELDLLASDTEVRPFDLEVDNLSACRLVMTETKVRKTVKVEKYEKPLGVSLIVTNCSLLLTSIAVVKDDYGPNTISGLDRYQNTKNELLICLLCNDKIFRKLHGPQSLNNIYQTKYVGEQLSQEIIAYYPKSTGNITFKDLILGQGIKR